MHWHRFRRPRERFIEPNNSEGFTRPEHVGGRDMGSPRWLRAPPKDVEETILNFFRKRLFREDKRPIASTLRPVSPKPNWDPLCHYKNCHISTTATPFPKPLFALRTIHTSSSRFMASSFRSMPRLLHLAKMDNKDGFTSLFVMLFFLLASTYCKLQKQGMMRAFCFF